MQEVRAIQYRAPEISALDQGVRKVGVGQIAATKGHIAQIRPEEIDALQVRTIDFRVASSPSQSSACRLNVTQRSDVHEATIIRIS